MKSLLLFFFFPCVLFAEPLTLKLEYENDESSDYSAQIMEAFGKLLLEDEALAKEFAMFEMAPEEEKRGSYLADPTVTPLLLSKSQSQEDGAKEQTYGFTRTVALYYRFDDGVTGGMYARSGFFALFSVTGKEVFRNTEGNTFERSSATVTAEFHGFSRGVNGPEPRG